MEKVKTGKNAPLPGPSPASNKKVVPPPKSEPVSVPSAKKGGKSKPRNLKN